LNLGINEFEKSLKEIYKNQKSAFNPLGAEFFFGVIRNFVIYFLNRNNFFLIRDGALSSIANF
jgi:hypothetical protein